METCLLSPDHDAALAVVDAAMSLQAIDHYFRQLHWITPLPYEEETMLLRRIERSRNVPADAWLASLARHARDRIVEAYQPLIARNAKRFARLTRSMDILDCIQEGSLGLLDALDHYCLSVHWYFEAYAILYIRRAIVRAIRQQDSMIRLPERLHREAAKVWMSMNELRDQMHRWPTDAEIAEVVGMKQHKVEDVLTYCQYQLMESIQGLLKHSVLQGEDPEERLLLTHLWESSPAASASVDVLDVVEQAMQTTLTPRQREVMELRYGLGGYAHHSQMQAAKVLGFNAWQDVQYHEYRAKARLRTALAPVVEALVS